MGFSRIYGNLTREGRGDVRAGGLSLSLLQRAVHFPGQAKPDRPPHELLSLGLEELISLLRATIEAPARGW